MSVWGDPMAAAIFGDPTPIRYGRTDPARLGAALDWARETDPDTNDILRGAPPLKLAHGTLQAHHRRTTWVVTVSASVIATMRIVTIAGSTAARSLRLPDHLKATS